MQNSVKSQPKVSKSRLNIEKLLVKTVKLFLKHPPHTLTYSKISRLTKTPRSTLYYYFGNDVSNLLIEATRFSLNRFFIIENPKSEYVKFSNWEDFQTARLSFALKRVKAFPWAPRVYLMFRDDQGPIGKAVRKIESKYLDTMEQAWRYYHPGQRYNKKNEIIASSLKIGLLWGCLLYTSPSPRDLLGSRMPSSA